MNHLNRILLLSALIVACLMFGLLPGYAGTLHPDLVSILSLTETSDAVASPARAEPIASLRFLEQTAVYSFGGQVELPLSQILDGLLGTSLRIGVLVKTVGERALDDDSFLDIPLQFATGTIAGMRVSAAELARLAASDDVDYVEPAWRTQPALDDSIPAIHADALRLVSPTLTGEGVLIGIVDTGVDYTHLDFRTDETGDGFEESSRIVSIWDQTQGLFGIRYDREDIERDLRLGFGSDQGIVREADTDGHGTSVLGIAAGDGSSSAAGLVGVAPGADLIVVKTPFYTSDILAGVEFILDEAAALGQPVVVNLSLGGHSGPHDGTSLFEQGLTELAVESGAAIVVSAGNEGDETIHVSQTLAVGGSYTFSVAPTSISTELEIWYPGASSFALRVVAPSGETVHVPAGATGSLITPHGSLYVDNASFGVSSLNGDAEASVRLSALSGAAWTITVSNQLGGGTFHGWITSGSAAFHGGDSAYTIAEPGNAFGIITVGSFNSKSQWISSSGSVDYRVEFPVGAFSSFSSQGPTRDGRIKPDLSAPGAWIMSSASSDAWPSPMSLHPDGQHVASAGTSFAAPHVSGVIALMLSLAPSLSVNALLDKLTDTARSDLFTGSVPNLRWGFGKLDAQEAAISIIPDDPDPPPAAVEVPELDILTNPASTIAEFAVAVPAGTTSAVLKIYSILGALVYSAPIEADAESSIYTWDLTSARGGPAANGLYLCVLVTPRDKSETARLVIDR
ncbi:S8 family serine peptidase [Candidatus Bipolaricaulota bacterium]|nr:S8 family serine peptidase [Candidatus Bipolaricaulota bacterium]